MQFHLSHFGPSPVWPIGGFALYRISGDQIAAVIGYDAAGRTVVRRDPWPGYIGTFATLDEVNAAITAALAEGE